MKIDNPTDLRTMILDIVVSDLSKENKIMSTPKVLPIKKVVKPLPNTHGYLENNLCGCYCGFEGHRPAEVIHHVIVKRMGFWRPMTKAEWAKHPGSKTELGIHPTIHTHFLYCNTSACIVKGCAHHPAWETSKRDQ